MKFGHYVNTTAKNLREYNRMQKDRETVYVGFRKEFANVPAERHYIDYIKGTNTVIGHEYKIYFNCDEA